MRFGEGLAFTYRESWAFIRKAWWLVPVPIIPILLFSLAEIHELVPLENLEMAGYLVTAIDAAFQTASTYWVMRFLALERSVSAAISVNRQSAASFAPYLVCMSLIWLGIGLAGNAGVLGYFLLWLTTSIIICMFAPWSVMAPSRAVQR